ncbi:hypothetical protein CKJ90_32530, partial [Klebsiella pneumoniae]
TLRSAARLEAGNDACAVGPGMRLAWRSGAEILNPLWFFLTLRSAARLEAGNDACAVGPGMRLAWRSGAEIL